MQLTEQRSEAKERGLMSWTWIGAFSSCATFFKEPRLRPAKNRANASEVSRKGASTAAASAKASKAEGAAWTRSRWHPTDSTEVTRAHRTAPQHYTTASVAARNTASSTALDTEGVGQIYNTLTLALG